jgi:hypothetical protein
MKLYIVNGSSCTIDTEDVFKIGRKYVYRMPEDDGWYRKKNEFTCIIKACKYLVKICENRIKYNEGEILSLKNNNIVIAENKKKAQQYIDGLKKPKGESPWK